MKSRLLFKTLLGLLFLSQISCKRNGPPDLFDDGTFSFLSFFGKNYCLDSGVGCSSWVVYLQEDGKHGEVFHLNSRKLDFYGDRSCSTDADVSYSESLGRLIIKFTEVNPNYPDKIAKLLEGAYSYKDGQYGYRFYSESNPDISLIRMEFPK